MGNLESKGLKVILLVSVLQYLKIQTVSALQKNGSSTNMFLILCIMNTNTHILISFQPILIIARRFCPFHHTGALLLHASIIQSPSWKEVAVLCSAPNALLRCDQCHDDMEPWSHLLACLEEICSFVW